MLCSYLILLYIHVQQFYYNFQCNFQLMYTNVLNSQQLLWCHMTCMWYSLTKKIIWSLENEGLKCTIKLTHEHLHEFECACGIDNTQKVLLCSELVL